MRSAGVPPATVKAFSCHARAFIEIPFGLHPDRSDGVVCIDTFHPLSKLKIRDLERFAETIRNQYGMDLALLWRTRVQ